VRHNGSGTDSDVPAVLEDRIPASTLEELNLIDKETQSKEIYTGLVCIWSFLFLKCKFIYL